MSSLITTTLIAAIAAVAKEDMAVATGSELPQAISVARAKLTRYHSNLSISDHWSSSWRQPLWSSSPRGLVTETPTTYNRTRGCPGKTIIYKQVKMLSDRRFRLLTG